MSTLTESSDFIDPEVEVKKLQDLVQKLERQNLLLRTKTHGDGKQTQRQGDNNGDEDKSVISRIIPKPVQLGRKPGNSQIDLEANGIIDVSCISDEDESWLLSTPSKTSVATSTLSPLQWMRQEFETPSPDMTPVRKSLSEKLDTLKSPYKMASSSLSSPSLRNSKPAIDFSSPQLSGMKRLTLDWEDDDDAGSRINTATFTRPRKSQSSTTHAAKVFSDLTHNGSSESKPHSSQLELEDVVDVQVVARMQEEMTLGAPVLEHTSADVTHLDQEIAALEDDVNEEMRNKRRSMQFSDLQRLARLQEDSLRASFSSTYGNNPFKNGKGRSADGSMENVSSTNNFRGDEDLAYGKRSVSSASTSSQSSPSDSPYSSSQTLEARAQGDVTRKSMPNLTRDKGLKSHTRPSSNDVSRSKGSVAARSTPAVNGSALRQIRTPPSVEKESPSPPPKTPSPSTRSGIPSPRRSGGGIPRPMSKLPTARRPTATSPKRTPALRQVEDDSWKDGCY